jgi:OTU domain-containing protein 6
VVSAREVELEAIERELSKDGLAVKLIASDGHCLYRAVVDQIKLQPSDVESPAGVFTFGLSVSGSVKATVGQQNTLDVKQLRQAVASELREHSDDYKPFVGLDGGEFEEYCDRVASYAGAEWGGQVEIQAMCAILRRDIWVYSANTRTPILKMGNFGESAPLRLSYHRQYYALGEHYNSVVEALA